MKYIVRRKEQGSDEYQRFYYYEKKTGKVSWTMPDYMSETSVETSFSESATLSGSVQNYAQHQNLKTVSELPVRGMPAHDSVQVVGQTEWTAFDFMDDHHSSGREKYAQKAKIIRKRRRKRKMRILVLVIVFASALFGVMVYYKFDHIDKLTTRIRRMISLDSSYLDKRNDAMIDTSNGANLGTNNSDSLPLLGNTEDTKLDSRREKIKPAAIGSKISNIIHDPSETNSKASNFGALIQHSAANGICLKRKNKKIKLVNIGSKISNIFRPSKVSLEAMWRDEDVDKQTNPLAPLYDSGGTTDLRKVVMRPAQCFLPFSYMFSRTCRKLAREKPMFDVHVLIDSMMQ